MELEFSIIRGESWLLRDSWFSLFAQISFFSFSFTFYAFHQFFDSLHGIRAYLMFLYTGFSCLYSSTMQELYSSPLSELKSICNVMCERCKNHNR